MPSSRNTREVLFGGERLWLDPSAALYLPDHATLIVSDLHLEKGSFLSQTGAPVPLYDTLDTLQQLQTLVQHYQPEHVILLGDTFHDRKALQRLPEKERQLLLSLIESTPNWHWVTGNHDVDVNIDLPGSTRHQFKIGNLNLMHEPAPGLHPLIVGHFHPKITTHISGHKVKGKVFILDKSLFILPSFGTYTGGLLTSHSVYNQHFTSSPTQYMILKDKIWKVAGPTA